MKLSPCTLAAVSVVSCLAACSQNDLSGSLGDFYKLDYDHVRARLYESELSIEYAKDDGSVPVRVTLRRADVHLSSGGTYDLAEVGAITGQLADGTYIPPLIDGELTLDEFSATDNADISGGFDAKLEGVRDQLSVAGDFDTVLHVVDWPVRPER